MWIFCRLFLLMAGVIVVNFQLALRQGEFATPISVRVEGLSERELADARLLVIDLVDSRQFIAPTAPGSWDCPPRCIVEVLLEFPAPVQSNATVHVTLGSEAFTFQLQELESYHGTYRLPQDVNLGAVPSYANCRNWPGRDVFISYFLASSAPGLTLVLLLALTTLIGSYLPIRDAFRSALGITAPPFVTPDSNVRWWSAIGCAGLIVGFSALEFMQPYYFTQDDVMVGELPAVVLGCRSLWAGVFPDWNPYVFLGAPLAPMGFWSITYPPMLASYAVARHVLGDECATMEVFAALHLLAGFFAQRLLCRRIGMSAFVANLAALSFVFAGCILIMGRSWHYFIAYAVWLPMLGLAIERFRQGPVGWKWAAGVGLIFGLAYHAGFPQIVANLGIFFCAAIAAVAIGDRLPFRRVAIVAPAFLFGIGLSAPLLLHHLQMTGGHERFTPNEPGVYDQLQGAFLPYPLAMAELPIHWGSFDVEKMGHFYFFGGLFAVLFALQAVGFWTCWPDRSAWARAWWVPCGMFAFLLLLGDPGMLWKAMAELPMSKFYLRYSIRFYPLFAFCAILGGGLVLERILAVLRQRRSAEVVVGVLMSGVLAYHLAMCQSSFYTYGFRAYPELPAGFEETFHPYADKQFVSDKNSRRIASWTTLRSVSPDYYASLPLNLPHYYQVPSVFGYDPVVEGQPRVAQVYRKFEQDPVAAYKAYGVGWHLCSVPETPTASPNKGSWFNEHTVNHERAYRRLPKAELKVLQHSQGVTLYELPDVDPLAFGDTKTKSALPMHLHGRGADVDVTSLAAGARVTLNFLWQPQMTCTLDGEVLTLEADEWQRIVTTLPRPGWTLAFRYEPPWLQTCTVGAGICAVALSFAWLLGWFGRRDEKST